MYLQIDEGFVGHPKTRAFCGRMQDPNAAMYLIKLWTWAVRSAPTGDLSEMNAWSIEDVVGYRLADGKCYAAMVACGFVDESETGVPTAIHNWAKRTGGDIAKMETEANRKRLLRAHKGGTCEPMTCQFHRRATDAATDVVVTSAGHPADTSGTADGRQVDDRHQDKARQVQTRSESDAPSAAPMRSDPAHPAGARSNGGAKLWNEHDWRERFGRAWREKYQTAGYGDAGDTKACVALGEVLWKIPTEERLAAQAKAPEMFAEFLANGDPRVSNRRHPFLFFVHEWGGLRVGKLTTAPPAGRGQARSAGNVDVLQRWLDKDQGAA
jgi:hypothetical protein